MDNPHLEEAKRLLGHLRPGSHFVSAEPLGGGMSNDMVSVRWGEERFILRVPGAYIKTIYEDPVGAEWKTLVAVRQAGVLAPEPVARGDAFLLLGFIEGTPTANPSEPSDFVEQMACELAAIHRVSVADGSFDHLPPTRSAAASNPSPNIDLREDEVLAALRRREPIPPTQEVLRHGDFWPGNVLWCEGKICGVLDWENALRGPAIADLAISRLDIAWILGFEAMEAFTLRYLDQNPIDTSLLPYWDLRISLRCMGNLPEWVAPYQSLSRPDITFDQLRATLLEFVDRALSQLKAEL